jgi:DNA-directed RNA polymerase specialized sigma24 family protein
MTGPTEEALSPLGAVDFDAFAARVSAPLRQALVAAFGVDRGAEAHALAMAYAFEHGERMAALDSPVAYLFSVGRSQTRDRRKRLPVVYAESIDDPPEFEPALAGAVGRLPEKQRIAVFLVVGCGWSNAEVGRLTGKSESTVRTLVQRALVRLRRELHVEEPSS